MPKITRHACFVRLCAVNNVYLILWAYSSVAETIWKDSVFILEKRLFSLDSPDLTMDLTVRVLKDSKMLRQ